MTTCPDQKKQSTEIAPGIGQIGTILETLGLFLLSNALDLIIALLLRHGKPGFLTEDQKRTAGMIKTSIYARLVVEGFISKGRGTNRYPEWDTLNHSLYQKASATPPAVGTSDENFIDGLEKLVAERFSQGNQVFPLIDGPASFEQRYALIEAAKESIYIATWKLYGDETGIKMVDTLLAKRQQAPSLDMRVMVDGNVATRDPKSLAQLKRLVDAGIPVAFHHYDERPFDGFHYKVTVVDGATSHPAAIAGGMNIGNEYSHAYGTALAANPDRRKWRDTDVRIDGPSARADYLTFIQLWNGQASRQNAIEPFGQILMPISLASNLVSVPNQGSAKVLITVDEPEPRSPQKVTLALIYGIHCAQHTIDIENAYFMDVPAIRDALVAAMKRGVTVRILTNSLESVDEKAVAVPILRGLYNLLIHAEASAIPSERCRVYARKKLRPALVNADTLHSKFMVVDQEFCQVASYNIHARSLRLEVEGAHNIVDKELGTALSTQFSKDIEDAISYPCAKDITFPDDVVSQFLRYMHLDPVLM